MDEASTALKWLNEDEREEWVWAASYLTSRAVRPESVELGATIGRDFNALTRAIHKLESTINGLKLVARLRNAIRQRRYRLSKGGKKTCSFTLSKDTKAALKKLATSSKTTETAIIRTLIEGASKLAQDQKAKELRMALVAKVAHNSSKLSQELNEVKIKEANKHLGRSLEQAARWETYLGDELPELTSDQETAAVLLAKKRMREIQEVIRVSVAKREMMSPRSV